MAIVLGVVSAATAETVLSARQVAVGNGVTCAADEDGNLLCWGRHPFVRPGRKDGSPEPGATPLGRIDGKVQQVSLGLHHGCLLTAAGNVLCWGSNQSGQLGSTASSAIRTVLDRPASTEPVVVPGLQSVSEIDAGGFHTCAVTQSGGVFCWGDNRQGQPGSPDPATGPVAVTGFRTGVRSVSAGMLHSCALLEDGSIQCWGDGSYGQLGSGSKPDKPQFTPKTVERLGGKAIDVSAGRYHSCATLASGSVRCWGWNKFGQIGDGTQDDRPRPVTVRNLSGKAVAVSAGDAFSCARMSAGPPACWGWDDYGQLASGDAPGKADRDGFTMHLSPTHAVGVATDVADLVAGDGHACALTPDGAVQCWGMNDDGQLGDQTREDRPRPVSPAVAAGSDSDGAAEDAAVKPSGEPKDTAGAELAGIDISYHSGRIDWRAFEADNYHFAFTLATAGLDFKDPLFEYHWARMKQAGLRRGAYHFFVPHDDPKAQAEWFIDNVPLAPGDLAPVVDIESLRGNHPPSDLSARLRTFIDLLETHYGVPPIIYTGPSFWDDHMSDRFGDYPLWVAHYDTDTPRIPKGWTAWDLWQWKGNANLKGVSRVVDLNRFRGTVADLQKLDVGGAALPAADPN